MSEVDGPGPTDGTTSTAHDIGTSTSGPQATGEGQPSGQAQTTVSPGPAAATAEETFFDPTTLSPDLVPAYKQMQKAFTKKMQEFSEGKQKAAYYDQFRKDPIGEIQKMAAQMGYRLTRAEAAGAANAATGTGNAPWQPNTWEEVISRAKQEAKQELMREIDPMIGEMKNLKRENTEKLLDDSCPDWRLYEEEMVSNLRAHPSLANDPVKLYRMSLPPEVLESRATQAALRKMQGQVSANRMGGTSTTKQPPAAIPDGPITFNQAVEFARKKLAEQGMRSPVN